MATSKQEQIYNEIIEYYSYADSLIKAVEETNHKISAEQFLIVEDVTSKLEECADKLTTQYIEYVKNGEPDLVIEKIGTALNDISSKVEECRNKILMLYKE